MEQQYKAPLPMAANFDFLPIEIQTSIVELRALGTPDAALALLIDRTLHALENKTNSLQLDVIRIEESMSTRVDRIGDKLAGDVRAALGSTNAMLVDIHAATQQQGAAVGALRAEFQSFGESVSDRIGGVERRMDISEADRRQINARLAEIERMLEIAGNHHQSEHDRYGAGGGNG